MYTKWPWWRGMVVIATAYRTEDPVFESRHGVCKVFSSLCIAVLLSKLNMHPFSLLEKNKCSIFLNVYKMTENVYFI
jgi:hypothetical protein